MHYRLRTAGDTPLRQAVAVGLGTFFGCLPVWGLHLPLCVITARRCGLNLLTMYLSTHLSNPLTLPFLLLAEWHVGYLVMHGETPGRGAIAFEVGSLLALTRDLLAGSLVVGALAGLAVGLVAHRIGLRWRRPALVRRLTDEAAKGYLPAGIFAWEYVRGKLDHDPVYLDLLAHGRLPPRGAILDLGCGRGILLALLATARRLHAGGAWDGTLAAPGEWTLVGVERDARAAAQAARALGPAAQIEVRDLAAYAPPPAAAVLLLDVLHYLPAAEQEALLARIARALEPGGILLIREGDTAPRWRYALTRVAERAVALVRRDFRQRFHFRASADWSALLRAQGLTVRVTPMRRGTPFSNVLIEARRAQPGRPSSSENEERGGTSCR
jgi:uncharacterized protein (DUF2062 family)/trans-aconitate methyltransferase